VKKDQILQFPRSSRKTRFSLGPVLGLALLWSSAASAHAQAPGGMTSAPGAAPNAPSATYSGSSKSAAPSLGLSSQNPFAGSVPSGKAIPEVLQLSFADAIDRGLRQNLGLLLASDNTLSARGQRWKELSDLLPNVSAGITENVQTTSLAALGFRLPGFPRVIGPFNFLDARAYLSQSIFNLNAIERSRASSQSVKASQANYKDARELVVLAVGNAYLQALAGAARVDTADAQVKTAQALYTKAVDQQKAGVAPAIDALRSQVQLQTRQQQLIVARNNFAKQKLGLARIIGLPPGQEFALSEKAPYQPLTALSLEENLKRAYTNRPDYQALQAQVKAAELSRKAAWAQHLPSLGISANYGDIGVSPFTSNGTYQVAGTLNIPIFAGNRAHGEILQAEATLRQQRSQLDNLRGQIDYEVRTAMLDLQAAADQVEVARSSVDLAQQTLTQAQDRFSAGVADNLEVIQAQEAVAAANENYIASLYAHNVAKVELARAIGYAEQGVREYLKGK
jgi:outer membrane protein TolC